LLSNIEDAIFKSYDLTKLSPQELLVHGDTPMVSKLFLKKVLPIIRDCLGNNPIDEVFRVLELGGGFCFNSYYLKKYVKGFELVSTDVSPYALNVSSKLENVFKLALDHRSACDAQNLPFPDKSFNVVFGTEFLHHCPSLLFAVKEISRVLKPNGFFLGLEPMCGKITKPIIMVLSGASSRTKTEHILENRYTFSEWQTAFANYGLKVSLITIDDPKIYRSLIGQKGNPEWYNGRYLEKYFYSIFLQLLPPELHKFTPNATLMVIGAK
jgi:SAM-dependent methyltransferase